MFPQYNHATQRNYGCYDEYNFCVQVHGAYMDAISHYYAALVHMTIVKGLIKSNGELNICGALMIG